MNYVTALLSTMSKVTEKLVLFVYELLCSALVRMSVNLTFLESIQAGKRITSGGRVCLQCETDKELVWCECL